MSLPSQTKCLFTNPNAKYLFQAKNENIYTKPNPKYPYQAKAKVPSQSPKYPYQVKPKVPLPIQTLGTLTKPGPKYPYQAKPKAPYQAKPKILSPRRTQTTFTMPNPRHPYQAKPKVPLPSQTQIPLPSQTQGTLTKPNPKYPFQAKKQGTLTSPMPSGSRYSKSRRGDISFAVPILSAERSFLRASRTASSAPSEYCAPPADASWSNPSQLSLRESARSIPPDTKDNTLAMLAVPSFRTRGDSERSGGGGRRGIHFMHSRNRMTVDPLLPTMPGQSMPGFLRPNRLRMHQA